MASAAMDLLLHRADDLLGGVNIALLGCLYDADQGDDLVDGR